MADWQPIETAPKDGAWVFLYWRSMSLTLYPLVAFWEGEDWQTVGDFGLVGGDTPSHWMPLPAPPEQSQ